MTIWKYSLLIESLQPVTMPIGAEILDIQFQHGTLQMWALVNPDKERMHRMIEIIGTGHTAPDLTTQGKKRIHLATVQDLGGSLVWHVFEIR